MNKLSNVDTKLSIYEKSIGYDLLAVLLIDPHIRSKRLPNEEIYLSAVDLMSVFSDVDYSPRQYWNEQKRRLFGVAPEL